MKRAGKTKDKILQHWSKFRKIWASFEIIAEHALNIGASVYHEWPTGCMYWSNSRVAKFLKKYNFSYCKVNGCMYGLK